MPKEVFSAEEVEALLAAGAQLVDVLEPESYVRDHIPGAINIHLKRLDAQAASVLDRSRPVIVYCNDFG
ncbi:MAG TPA: rhodanese-like domain-containing protein [Candidatus Limnocylindrales bacterium]|nr:rhodanese-like domain-containing protein [Candidatus Limnocylindrales bacterium]